MTDNTRGSSTSPAPLAPLTALDAPDPRATAEAILFEIRRVIVGQDEMLERVLVASSPAATSCSRASPAWPRR